MNIKDILVKARTIWGFKMQLPEIVIAMGKTFGDICRWARNAKKNTDTHTDDELKKELGNMIVSSVRWCDDLGYDPEECVTLALRAQEQYYKENYE